MILDLGRFYQACNPSTPLDLGDPNNRPYYIDFSTVRGGKIVRTLGRTITTLSPDRPTCQLFTGHIGCGKSTELLRLKALLEEQNFEVVYFESSEDLDMGDMDITDILLAIARQVSEQLQRASVNLQPRRFQSLLHDAVEFLQTPIDFSAQASVPGVGEFSASSSGEVGFSLPLGIASLTAKTRESPKLRHRLRNFLEPRTAGILEAINQELLDVANQQLKGQGKKGLVVIVDNLDRVHNQAGPAGRLLPEYLFIDRGQQLRQLNCHLVYTIPLSLIFSSECETLKNRLGGGITPKVLPMVPVKTRTGETFPLGMKLLRQMVLTRAFPQSSTEEQEEKIIQLFQTPDLLDRLCQVSGGHMRNLLGMLFSCLQQEDPPFSRDILEAVIRDRRDYLTTSIKDEEWELLYQVVTQQSVQGELEYLTLLRSMFVFEYRDSQGSWFALNPALREHQKFKQWLAQKAVRTPTPS
ncbi:AAA family ATPase [Roseofilum casamattae]|uniref:AAA family ATPase n=1 Tax=Roseofilum casamattae BLCC-M143 TaxID=3022442 RepID=A0ABT7C0K3_9CYAN|nr:AAA family ATPase [Roseofilum casamattae]MDJ1184983.1 AAA family ATPase [Roseofilum casamattae BLCC-M143]